VHLVEHLLRQSLLRLAHAGVVRHQVGRAQAKELANRPLSVHRQEVARCEVRPSR
jgi:hypothetical protein